MTSCILVSHKHFPIFCFCKTVIFVIISGLFEDLRHHFFHFLLWKEISEHLMIWIYKNCKGISVIHTVRGINRHKWYLSVKLVHKFGSRICYVESHKWEIWKGKETVRRAPSDIYIMCYILHVLPHLILIKTFWGEYEHFSFTDEKILRLTEFKLFP